MWWWLWSVVWAGPADEVTCPEEPLAAVVDAAREVERAWLSLDGPGYDLARNRMGRLLPCVDVPLRTEDAVQVHRARGLIGTLDGDTEAARRSFGAIHVLQPDWAPDPALIPREHLVWKVYASAVDDDEQAQDVPFRMTPEHGWLVDGVLFPRPGDPLGSDGQPLVAYELPGDRAFILQVFDAERAISYTGYHWSAADVPVRELALLDRDGLYRVRRRKAARIAGSVLGTALLASGATVFALGWQERQAFEDGSLPLDVQALQAAQDGANLKGGLGEGLAGLGALAFTLAWSVPW